MNFPFSFKAPSNSKKREEFNLDHSHTLTHNFGVNQVISCITVKPNDDITIDLSAFTRLMPLPCPTFGGVKVTHRAYFVPISYCLRHFDEFIAFQKAAAIPMNSSLAHIKIPYFTPLDVFKFLLDSNTGSYTADTDYVQLYQGEGPYDLYTTVDDNPWTANYTTKGRRIVSWLSQLGYKIPPTTRGSYTAIKYDVTRLFAWWKFYLDWVVPARFVLNEPRFVYIKSVLDNLETGSQQYHLTYNTDNVYSDTEIDISQFLMVPTSFLDDDIYTSAFVTPYGVENDSSSLGQLSGLDVQIPSPADSNQLSDYAFSKSTANGNTPYLVRSPSAVSSLNSSINQFSLLSLARLQRLVDRKKITSTSVLDFLRSEYGIAPSHDSLHLSTYLGSTDSQIMVGDIMATATTDSQLGTTVVGQYAGKGLGGSSAKWRLQSQGEHGYIFITAEISTKSSYVNGVSPLCQRFEPLDYFKEEFDNVGVRAIKHSELVYNTFESLERLDPVELPNPDSIFGFSPRYSEYKYMNDVVSGDFMFPSVNTGLDSWYLNRKFKITEEPIIGLEFLSATSDSVGSQYDRIFQNTDNVDHFYSVYQIDVHETSLMEKLFDYFKSINDTDIDKDDIDVSVN